MWDPPRQKNEKKTKKKGLHGIKKESRKYRNPKGFGPR